jgi:hypothetical protein
MDIASRQGDDMTLDVDLRQGDDMTGRLAAKTKLLTERSTRLRTEAERLLARFAPSAPPAASPAAPPCEQNEAAYPALDALLSLQANNGGGRPGVLAPDEIRVDTLKTTLQNAGVPNEATDQLLRSLGCGHEDEAVRADLLLYHLRGRRNTKQLEDHVRRLKVHELVARRLPSILQTCARPGEDEVRAGEDPQEGIHNLLALSRMQLREALRGLEDEIEACLWEESERLCRLEEERQAQSFGPSNGKFEAVVGKFGDLKHFKGGLDAHIGLPNPNTWKAIRDEHVKSADSLDRFCSGNHKLDTTPHDEYEFVVNPQRGKEYAGLHARADGYPGRMPLELDILLLAAGTGAGAGQHADVVFSMLDADGDGRISRKEYEAGFNILDTNGDGLITRAEFNCASGAPFAMLDKDGDGFISKKEWEEGFDYFDADKDGYITAKEFTIMMEMGAKDIEDHVERVLAGPHAAAVALIALTAGGMGHVSSKLWVRFGFTQGWGDVRGRGRGSGTEPMEGSSEPQAATRDVSATRDLSFAHVLEAASYEMRWGKDAVQALIARQLQRLCKARLLREELVALRLYTGPMYFKYNAILRQLEGCKIVKTCKGNKYCTTIHCIVSGIVKLSAICDAEVAGSREVYRGISGVVLPPHFLKRDEFGCRGGVDFGLISTSRSMQVAIDYLVVGKGGVPIVFEMTLGQVSCDLV